VTIGAWASEDRYFPLDAELSALREAGFDEVECFWRRGLSAVTCGFCASRPPPTRCGERDP
jgi:hypothetical protein